MRKPLRSLSVAASTATLAVALGVVVPALEGPAPASAAGLPVVLIERTQGGAAFGPKVVSASWSASTSQQCSAANDSLILVNTTASSQKIFGFPHRYLGLLPAGAQSGLCFFGSGTKTYLYFLANGNKLTVNVS
jgi:hypothetical protein